jgi:hypothetical protein
VSSRVSLCRPSDEPLTDAKPSRLADRGLDSATPRRRGHVVRFYVDGAPAVLLYDLETGAPINIIRRQIDREPKILSLDLHTNVAILVEDLTDSLAAPLAVPTCAIVGADGWYMMPRVVAAMWAAVDARLVLRKSVRGIEFGAHHDLADASRTRCSR